MRITLLDGFYAITRLRPNEAVPDWAFSGEFWTASGTPDELSLTCAEAAVPPGLRTEGGWRALKLEGPFDFALTGILKGVLDPLAEAKVGIFAVSTYDTDYVLVKEADLEKAVAALASAGYEVGR